MEGTPLYNMLQLLERPEPLPTLVLGPIQVYIHASSEPIPIVISGMAPFHTIEDLQRAIWLQEEKNTTLFPKYTFLGYIDEDGFKCATRTWYSGETDSADSYIQVGDPEEVIRNGLYNEQFLDGDELNETLRSSSRSRTTLEDAFLVHGGELPEFHLYTLQYLLGLRRPDLPRDWYGLFYPYFPHLKLQPSYPMTEANSGFATSMETYITAKLEQTGYINSILESLTPKELVTTAVDKLQFIWKTPVPNYEGADVLFFGATVNEVRPFMRLLTPNSVGLTKLYQPDLLQPPAVSDPKLLQSWTSERSSLEEGNALHIKTLIRKATLGIPALYGTFVVYDDATATFLVQAPKALRILEFSKDLGALGPVMTQASEDLPISLQEARLEQANISVTLEFGEVPSKSIRSQVLKRLSALGTFFQPVSPPSDEKRPPLICLRYKTVSNFGNENRIHSYLAYKFQRTELTEEQLPMYRSDVAREFELSLDEAQNYVTSFLLKRQELDVTDPDAKDFAPANNLGTDISIYSQSVSSFVFKLYNVQSITDLQRICSILSAVFLVSEEEWNDVTGIATDISEEEIAEAATVTEQQSRLLDMAVGGGGGGAGAVASAFELFEEEEGEGAPLNSSPSVGEAAAAAAAVGTAAAKPKVKRTVVKEEAPNEQKIVAFQFLIERLKRMDPVLYNFKTEIAGVKPYVRQCQATDDRQPNGFTEAEFSRILTIYAKDVAEGRVGFVIYGTEDTDRSIREAKGKTEQITVMRYGTNPAAPNYYLCANFFCLKDQLPLLADDFKKRVDREGNPKEKRTCPFCLGREIKNLKAPAPGETVIVRANKPKSDSPHSYIGFLGSGKHPQGYELPCCFVKRKDIAWRDDRFKILRDVKAKKTATEEVVEEEAAAVVEERNELETSLRLRVQQIINYQQLRYKIGREYIVGPEKYPLEPGKIGLMNLSMDAYFGQDSTKMVERPSVKMVFVDNARGMFRLGVYNKATMVNQSLFSALAPLLELNSIPEVVDYFRTFITPRVFLNLNFGNLLLEFFNPADEEPTPDVLASWALKHLLINNPETNPEISRFYRSYNRFMKYLADPTQKKQLRHFSHALAELRHLNLITIEYLDDPRNPSTQIDVACPLMGLDATRYANNDIGFLTHSPTGIWEPLVYVSRIVAEQTITTDKEGFYTISNYQLMEPEFPSVIRERYVEFFETCASSYRGAFTLQSHVDNRVLMPVTRALEILTAVPDILTTGLVRDAFNHLVAITIRDPYNRIAREILVPVVDDGNSFHYNTALKIHVGLKSIKLTMSDNIARLYEEVITPLFATTYHVYVVHSLLKTVDIVAFRLGNPENSPATILLPCKSDKNDAKLPVEDLGPKNFQFEYEINRKLIFETAETSWEVPSYVLNAENIQDLYEHVRLTFANYVVQSNEEGSQVRKKISELIERTDLPNYEKIRRLELEFTSLIESWLDPDPEYKRAGFTLLRKDCLTLPMDQCKGACREQGGTCKIHVPEQVQLGSKHNTNAARYFSLRLFDELIRIPAKRYELFSKTVRRVQIPRTNIHVGSEWIIPENVPAWYDLIHDRTSELGRELPQYYEEFSRAALSNGEANAFAPGLSLEPLPPGFAALLGERGQDQLAVQVIGRPEDDSTQSLLIALGLESIYKDGMDLSPTIMRVISKKFAMPIVVAYVSEEPIRVLGRSLGTLSLKTPILVLMPDYELGPGIVVVKSTASQAIPGYLLEGQIGDSIAPFQKAVRRPVEAAPAEALAEAAPAEAAVEALAPVLGEDGEPLPTARKPKPKRIPLAVPA